jgi:hypothetical protein
MAVAVLDVSSTDVAVTVTIASAGTLGGAVYVASAPLAVVVGLIVPQPGEQIAVPWVSIQVRPLPVGSLVTVPTNGCVPFTFTVAKVADRDTAMGVKVMLAWPKAVLSVCEFACRNSPTNIVQAAIFTSHGGVPCGVNCIGAEYLVGTPFAVVLGETVPHPGLHAE